jgi:hypothetical protein
VLNQFPAAVPKKTSAAELNPIIDAAVLNRISATMPRQTNAAMQQQTSAAVHLQTGATVLHSEASTIGRPISDFDDEEGAGCSFWANNREPK